MKKIICIAVLIAAVMLLLPLSVFTEQPVALATSAVIGSSSQTQAPAPSESFKVYDAENKSITEMTAADYVFGVVAAEMPALYEPEALKAQAIAAYTFACSRKADNSEQEYDITTDPATDQSFITEATARERWGENAELYVQKIKTAVNEADGYMITYNGTPITAVYHAISSGKTESCKDIWGTELPYLTTVTSEGDRLADGYISELALTAEELKEKFNGKVQFTADPLQYFSEAVRTESGTVKEISLCGTTLSGSEIRELLDLRSSNFEVSYQGSKFTFTVYGYGHGVGMSQNGANYMAKQGSSFEEILCHYYTGCKVEKIGN